MANEEIHDVYKDEEVIVVQMRVKDYKTMMKIIERDRSLGITAKYLLSIAGGILTLVAVFKLGILQKLGITG